MALKLTDEGATAIFTAFFKGAGAANTTPTTFTLKLFSDASAASDANTNASPGHTIFTGGGYSDATLLPANATVDTSVQAGIVSVKWPATTFTFATGAALGLTVKGYQVYATTNGVQKLLCEETTSNFTVNNNNDTYSVTPIIKIGNTSDTLT